MVSESRWDPHTAEFHSVGDAIASLQREGFDWRLVREYFRFCDNWASEGEYEKLLSACLKSIEAPDGQQTLLDMLDLQYAVFLEQVALQEAMLGPKGRDERPSVAFGERVMAYLEINSGYRPGHGLGRPSARSVLMKIPAGQLIHRLLGADEPK